MENKQTVNDIMVGIFDYPHVPYWFSIGQTMKIMKTSFFQNKKSPDPKAVLVFDERYSLMGFITLKEVLKGLEPEFLKPTLTSEIPENNTVSLTVVWDELFSKESKNLAEKTVNNIMLPVKHFVDPEDPIVKAAYIMLHNDLILLPVLEEKRRFAGLVRLNEVFENISMRILNKD